MIINSIFFGLPCGAYHLQVFESHIYAHPSMLIHPASPYLLPDMLCNSGISTSLSIADAGTKEGGHLSGLKGGELTENLYI